MRRVDLRRLCEDSRGLPLTIEGGGIAGNYTHKVMSIYWIIVVVQVNLVVANPPQNRQRSSKVSHPLNHILTTSAAHSSKTPTVPSLLPTNLVPFHSPPPPPPCSFS
jgi:hypothetical protein